MEGTGYIDGLSLVGMSVTSLHQNEDVSGPPSRSHPLQIATIPMDPVGLEKHSGKGRSLDLGFKSYWAPTRVREEAVLDFSEMGVRSKWREGAESGMRKVLESFERVLGENGYAKFKERASFSFFTSWWYLQTKETDEHEVFPGVDPVRRSPPRPSLVVGVER